MCRTDEKIIATPGGGERRPSPRPDRMPAKAGVFLAVAFVAAGALGVAQPATRIPGEVIELTQFGPALGVGAVALLWPGRLRSMLDQFIDAVRRVAAGATVMDPQVISKLLSRSDARGMIGSLTSREREVLEQMAEGRSNAAIASRLYVSESAVAKHTASIFAKLRMPRPAMTTAASSPSWPISNADGGQHAVTGHS